MHLRPLPLIHFPHINAELLLFFFFLFPFFRYTDMETRFPVSNKELACNMRRGYSFTTIFKVAAKMVTQRTGSLEHEHNVHSNSVESELVILKASSSNS